jgi:hypothetical protein
MTTHKDRDLKKTNSNCRGELFRLNVRVPPEQSELIWNVPGSVTKREICPPMLELSVIVKAPNGIPFLSVLILAMKRPEEAKGELPVVPETEPYPCIENVHEPTRACRLLVSAAQRDGDGPI